MAVVDFKKEQKELYLPSTKPSIIDVPPMKFIMVEGHGNPNTSPLYTQAVEILYAFSYAIKMNKKDMPEGYFEYVVPPLEGLWWFKDNTFDGNVINRKDEFNWIMMIRQPDFVTSDVFYQAKSTLAKKKPGLDTSLAYLKSFTEGLCGQIMHIGTYDDEGPTIEKLEHFIASSGYQTVMEGMRQHHEIYLGDPRKITPDKLKTVIRHPIVKI